MSKAIRTPFVLLMAFFTVAAMVWLLVRDKDERASRQGERAEAGSYPTSNGGNGAYSATPQTAEARAPESTPDSVAVESPRRILRDPQESEVRADARSLNPGSPSREELRLVREQIELHEAILGDFVSEKTQEKLDRGDYEEVPQDSDPDEASLEPREVIATRVQVLPGGKSVLVRLWSGEFDDIDETRHLLHSLYIHEALLKQELGVEEPPERR